MGVGSAGRSTSMAPAAALAVFALVLVAAERRWPLRRTTQPTSRRQVRNLAIAALAGAVVSLIETPLVAPATRLAERKRLGLLHVWPMPRLLRLCLGVALMDYSLYLWHVLMHRAPWLWRLHLPHHADLDLDTSTALRFHAAELAASAPWRVAQVLLIGVGPRTFAAWRTFTTACILFHHANLRLPPKVERILSLVLATPRMHGIHHSTVRDETHSNWSSGLSVWDRLHGTLRLDVPQAEIEIGVPAWRDPAELELSGVIALPFQPQRATWRDREGRSPRRGLNFQLIKEPAA